MRLYPFVVIGFDPASSNKIVAKKIHVIIIDYNQRDLWSCGGAPPGSLIIINYNLRFFVTIV